MLGLHMTRRLASRVRGPAPAVPVGQRASGGGLEDAVVRGVLELAVRIGEAMLSLGAPAADVTDAIRRVCSAFRVDCQVDLTFTAILVSHDPGPAAPPVTVLRVVQARSADYGRLSRVLALADDLATATPPPADGAGEERGASVVARVEAAHDRLDAVVAAPHALRRSMVALVLATMAAGVAVLLGGGVWVALVAGATTALIDVVVWRLARWGLPPFFLQAAGAAVATAVAVLLFTVVPVLPVELATVPPSLVVASGIVVLLAGLSLVGAAEDAINGFPVTANARVFEVLLLTLGIVVGIGAVLDGARRWGVALELVDRPTAPGPWWVQVLAAAVVAGAWALASYAGPRAALTAAAAGGCAWGLYVLTGLLGVGPAVGSAAAALVVGFAAEALSRRLRVPAIVTSVCGIVPLLPGLAIYRGLFALVDGDGLGRGAELLLRAATVGLGLAAGVTLGELLARLTTSGVRRAVPLRARARPGGGRGPRLPGATTAASSARRPGGGARRPGPSAVSGADPDPASAGPGPGGRWSAR